VDYSDINLKKKKRKFKKKREREIPGDEKNFVYLVLLEPALESVPAASMSRTAHRRLCLQSRTTKINKGVLVGGGVDGREGELGTHGAWEVPAAIHSALLGHLGPGAQFQGIHSGAHIVQAIDLFGCTWVRAYTNVRAS
jgi:hypothetical protein